jgi:hypothetical protein
LPPFTLSAMTGEVASTAGIWTDVVVSDSDGPELLSLRLTGPRGPPLSCAAIRGDSQAACTDQRGPNGEPIMITESKSLEGFLTRSVYVRRSGDSQLAAELIKHGVVQPGQEAHPERATHVLSVDQLLEIMLWPGVTL